MNRILAIGAHPDDIEFGCGGTISKLATAGSFVVYCCMTSGQSIDGVTGKILRTKEQNVEEVLAAASVMGAKQAEFLPFVDLHVPFSFESVSRVEALIKKYEIDTIFTHWSGDANQDHIATFKTTMAAARYVPNVLCYEQIPISRLSDNSIDINYYVNITDTFEQKIASAKKHVSQMEKYKSVGLNVEENLDTLARFRGIQARCRYAEGFQIIKMVA
jgi:LmbE family N-acetylglucosaminyl deacetylase